MDKKQVVEGVCALKELISQQKAKEISAFDEDAPIYLTVSLKKISNTQKNLKLKLPHSWYKSSTSVCIFVKDLDRTDRDFTKTTDHYTALFEKKGIENPPAFVPLKCIKLEHTSIESKRILATNYDVFLSDDRVSRLLPELLGSTFFKPKYKKFPSQINLSAKDLKREYEESLRKTTMSFSGRGSSSFLKIGEAALPDDQIAENIEATISSISMNINGGFNNIRSLHVSSKNTPAIPVFISLGLASEVDTSVKKRKLKLDPPEDVGVDGYKVRVLPDMRLQYVKDGDTGMEPKYLREAQPKPEKKLIKNINNIPKKRTKSLPHVQKRIREERKTKMSRIAMKREQKSAGKAATETKQQKKKVKKVVKNATKARRKARSKTLS